MDLHTLQKQGLRKHVCVRSCSQDIWNELWTTLSAAHQSPPCCWLLTGLSWLLLARVLESHGAFPSCASLWKEHDCLLWGAMAAGVPGSLNQKDYGSPQRTWKFPMMPRYSLLLQLGQSRLTWTSSFYCSPALPLFHACCVHPLPALLSASVPVPALLSHQANPPTPAVCLGLQNLLSLLLQ